MGAEQDPQTPKETPPSKDEKRIDPSTDPIKNILDKLYDTTLKYIFSNRVPTRTKLAVAAALYSAITGGMGLTQNLRKPSTDLNEMTLETAITDVMTTRNYQDQCFYEDKNQKLRVVFTEKTNWSAVFDMAASIATITAYTAPKTTHTLGDLPYYVAAPCTVLSADKKIDANTMGNRSAQATAEFMTAVRKANVLKDAGDVKGFYTFTPYRPPYTPPLPDK